MAGINYPGIVTPFYCNDGRGNFVLQKRSQNRKDEQGSWEMGGGRLSSFVSLDDNVLREVKKEYGCRGVIQERLHAHDIFREQDGIKTHWVVIPYFIKVDPGEVKNNEPAKIDELGWFTLDSLPHPLHSGLRYTLQNFSVYFEKYSSLKKRSASTSLRSCY